MKNTMLIPAPHCSMPVFTLINHLLGSRQALFDITNNPAAKAVDDDRMLHIETHTFCLDPTHAGFTHIPVPDKTTLAPLIDALIAEIAQHLPDTIYREALTQYAPTLVEAYLAAYNTTDSYTLWRVKDAENPLDYALEDGDAETTYLISNNRTGTLYLPYSTTPDVLTEGLRTLSLSPFWLTCRYAAQMIKQETLIPIENAVASPYQKLAEQIGNHPPLFHYLSPETQTIRFDSKDKETLTLIPIAHYRDGELFCAQVITSEQEDNHLTQQDVAMLLGTPGYPRAFNIDASHNFTSQYYLFYQLAHESTGDDFHSLVAAMSVTLNILASKTPYLPADANILIDDNTNPLSRSNALVFTYVVFENLCLGMCSHTAEHDLMEGCPILSLSGTQYFTDEQAITLTPPVTEDDNDNLTITRNLASFIEQAECVTVDNYFAPDLSLLGLAAGFNEAITFNAGVRISADENPNRSVQNDVSINCITLINEKGEKAIFPLHIDTSLIDKTVKNGLTHFPDNNDMLCAQLLVAANDLIISPISKDDDIRDYINTFDIKQRLQSKADEYPLDENTLRYRNPFASPLIRFIGANHFHLIRTVQDKFNAFKKRVQQGKINAQDIDYELSVLLMPLFYNMDAIKQELATITTPYSHSIDTYRLLGDSTAAWAGADLISTPHIAEDFCENTCLWYQQLYTTTMYKEINQT